MKNYRKFIEDYDYTRLDAEYGYQERVTPETLDFAMSILEKIGVEPLSVLPYQGGIDLFWGNQVTGHLLIHVYHDTFAYLGRTGRDGKRSNIHGSSLEDIKVIKGWF